MRIEEYKAKRRRRWKGDRHVRLHLWLIDSAAYRALSPDARAVLVELMRIYNGTNNGRLALSVRDAGKKCCIDKNAAARAFRALVEKGFIELTTPGAFSVKSRVAAEYALTEFRNDVTGAAATRLFMHWEPEN